MRLGIMQPYFFPYLGHFSLIASVDQWIVFDVTQYTPKSWMNRNRILHPKEGWQYVTVPLSNSSTSIKTYEAVPQNMADAKKSTLGKISHYKRYAPMFYKVHKLVEKAFDCAIDGTLVDLNVSALSAVCDYLDIPFSYRVCSRLDMDYPSSLGPGGWAPYICNQLGATEYVNPVGGKEIFDIAEFQRHNISLYFAEFTEFHYSTSPYTYEPNLSILDVLMWNSPGDIITALTRGTALVKAN